MNKAYWENRYTNHTTSWDVGYAVTPIKEYADQLTNKNLKILIPGAGNGYEAEYLYKQGFKNVYLVDFASHPLHNFKQRNPDFPDKQLLQQDFFTLEDTFDLIIEHTFFCALDVALRNLYVQKMNQLLQPSGTLAGLLFSIPLTEKGPPFGGSISLYKEYFLPWFHIKKMEPAYNSIKPRSGNEIFFILKPIK